MRGREPAGVWARSWEKGSGNRERVESAATVFRKWRRFMGDILQRNWGGYRALGGWIGACWNGGQWIVWSQKNPTLLER